MTLLEENGAQIETVYYLETPLDQKQLKELLDMLGKRADEIIRFGESVAKDLGISARDQKSEQEWIDLMVDNPILIERPIVVIDEQAVLGRPPENVLELL